jgi:AcrR family transcriptional regulator
MPSSPRPRLSARKKPRQARSAQLVDDLVEAALRVLRREGGRGFTTVRVAEEAGVSVGSLYQYFPNKEALLFRLQADEWTDTWGLLDDILTDRSLDPLDRLRHAVLTFFRSEREEASLRAALEAAGAVPDESPEASVHLARARRTLADFVAEAAPAASPEQRAFAADFLLLSMGAVGEKLTRQERSRAEVDAWARASAEMYASFLARLAAPGP